MRGCPPIEYTDATANQYTRVTGGGTRWAVSHRTQHLSSRYPAIMSVSMSGHAHNVIDAILHYVQGASNPGSPVYLLRAATRSSRPETYLVWDDTCKAMFEELVPADDEDRRLLDGVKEILEAPDKASDVLRRLERSQRIPFEHELELATFESTPSIYAVWDKLMADLNISDLTGKILRGHLWLEYSLEEVFRRRVASYDHFEKARLSFSAKTQLARSMNILAEDEYRLVLFLNKIRNGIAHQFTYTVTPEIESQLLAIASSDIKRTAQISASSTFPKGFERIFITLVVRLHLKIDHIETHERFDRWQNGKTSEVLAKLKF